MKRLLITDLDNTLYDWVTFFSHSFAAMIKELSSQIEVPLVQLQAEFRVVHQKYGDSEKPFSILEIPSVRSKYPDHNDRELIEILDKPLHAFNMTRKKYLKLYEGVKETLVELSKCGVKVVGHTEANSINSYHRLKKLSIFDHFTHLYALDGALGKHPLFEKSFDLPYEFITLVPRSERKPNPELLLDICSAENVPISEAVYVGDSLTRDMAMAVQAGVTSVWAKYGHSYDHNCWETLVSVTHWTDEDVKREKMLKEMYGEVKPDLVIENFSDILKLF